MRALLDATYALMVDESVTTGAARGDVVTALEKVMGEPLPDEVAAEEYERRRRARVAEENEQAVARLAGISTLPRDRG